MEIFYTSGLNKKVLSFFVHYIQKYFPFIKIQKLTPIHVVKTCLLENCIIHREHKMTDAIHSLITTEDKILLVLKEPWIEGQFDVLLNGQVLIYLLSTINTIDQLVWGLVRSIGLLYGLDPCSEAMCALNSENYNGIEFGELPLCKHCMNKFEKASKNFIVNTK